MVKPGGGLLIMMSGRGSWILKEIGHSSSLYLFSHSIFGLMEDQESFAEGDNSGLRVFRARLAKNWNDG